MCEQPALRLYILDGCLDQHESLRHLRAATASFHFRVTPLGQPQISHKKKQTKNIIIMVECMPILPWIILAFVCPPAVIYFSPRTKHEDDAEEESNVTLGRSFYGAIACCLTCCLWVPGVVFVLVLYVYADREVYKKGAKVTCLGSECCGV